MDGELISFTKVWTIAIAFISYSYFVASKIRNGILRLAALLPVLAVFLLLPLNLRSFHLCGSTGFLLAWLANFKLLLFAFHRGPLASSSASALPSFLHFAAALCLPIKIQNQKPNKPRRNRRIGDSPLVFASKILLLATVIRLYEYRNRMDPTIVLVLYCLHLYLGVEIVLALCYLPARAIFGAPIEPQFNEPYLSTSLHDFWSCRWNLIVPSILRPAVYDPTRSITSYVFGPLWAHLLAIVATFSVSGLMHEVMYYYFARVRPTWEVTSFFVLHGVCMAAEVVVNAAVVRRVLFHPAVSGPVTLAFLMMTARWLLFPQLIRNGVADRTIGECYDMVHFVKEKFVSFY